ncbi:MAG: sigma-70 family RNA polymerase sigma factor [bacterium]|nr:sigma-70 family RNA polymerase sigma factor [bacterium]
MQPPDETLELLQQWHGGDRAALTALIERDRAWVEARVRQRRSDKLRQHAETVDDFQELMLRALQYTPKFLCADRGQFRALVARMIENVLVDRARYLGSHRRDAQIQAMRVSQINLDSRVATSAGPDAAAAHNEEVAWMHLGMQFLDEGEREIVWQRQFEERAFVELAQEAGVSEDAVRMRFNRALLRLATIVQRLQRGELDGLLAETPA